MGYHPKSYCGLENPPTAWEVIDSAWSTHLTFQYITIWRVSVLGVRESKTKATEHQTEVSYNHTGAGNQVSVGLLRVIIEDPLEKVSQIGEGTQNWPQVFLEWSYGWNPQLRKVTSHEVVESSRPKVVLGMEYLPKAPISYGLNNQVHNNPGMNSMDRIHLDSYNRQEHDCPVPDLSIGTPTIESSDRSSVAGHVAWQESGQEFITDPTGSSNWMTGTRLHKANPRAGDDLSHYPETFDAMSEIGHGCWLTDYKNETTLENPCSHAEGRASGQQFPHGSRDGINKERQGETEHHRPRSAFRIDYDWADETADQPPVAWDEIEAYKAFHEDEGHAYWKWDQGVLRWKHTDSETGSVVYCPEELD